MACHIRGGPCRLVNFAFGKEDSIAVDRFQSTKPEIFEVQNWEVSRYLVYLNNRLLETAPLTPKSFIYN
jgi:hypothetical protein